MRAYFFGNFYLSSIQQGIQAQHCTAEMFVKYQPYVDPEGTPEGSALEKESFQKHRMLFEWASEPVYQTTILLNGGDNYGIVCIKSHFDDEENPYPWAAFIESQNALNYAYTCAGIVIPEKIYEAVAEYRKSRGDLRFDTEESLSKWELQLVKIISGCGMAR